MLCQHAEAGEHVEQRVPRKERPREVHQVGDGCVVGLRPVRGELETVAGLLTPAVAFGSNALFAYVLSELLGSVPGMLGFHHEAVCDTPAKSLIYAILFTSVFFVLNLVLYKKKVFIKI